MTQLNAASRKPSTEQLASLYSSTSYSNGVDHDIIAIGGLNNPQQPLLVKLPGQREVFLHGSETDSTRKGPAAGNTRVELLVFRE